MLIKQFTAKIKDQIQINLFNNIKLIIIINHIESDTISINSLILDVLTMSKNSSRLLFKGRRTWFNL